MTAELVRERLRAHPLLADLSVVFCYSVPRPSLPGLRVLEFREEYILRVQRDEVDVGHMRLNWLYKQTLATG